MPLLKQHAALSPQKGRVAANIQIAKDRTRQIIGSPASSTNVQHLPSRVSMRKNNAQTNSSEIA
jgi:hypothetical protein